MPPNIQPNWKINIFKYFTEQNRTSNAGIKCRIARIEVITVIIFFLETVGPEIKITILMAL